MDLALTPLTVPLNRSSHKNHRVLFVDDEPAIAFAYRRLLGSERFQHDVCENIEDATAHLKMYDYFAVVSDVRFTGSGNEDGLFFVSEVKKVQPDAKVILVTGYGSRELEMCARLLGASHYFEKPIRPFLILSLLRELHHAALEQDSTSAFRI